MFLFVSDSSRRGSVLLSVPSTLNSATALEGQNPYLKLVKTRFDAAGLDAVFGKDIRPDGML